jgi:hypothetical protein
VERLDMSTIKYIYYYFHNGYNTISIYRVDVFRCRFEMNYEGFWYLSEEGSMANLMSFGNGHRISKQITEEEAETFIGKEELVRKLLK